MQDPDPEFRPTPGHAEQLQPGLRRILAPNPSPMTFRGTNTYIVGETDLAVIDPGPPSSEHLDAILAAVLPGQRISHILVTHAHLDHSPLAQPLADQTRAPVIAFGDATAGRSEIMQHLAAEGSVAGGEGVHVDFAPDHCVGDGQTLKGEGWEISAHHTPGHFGNHLVLGWQDKLFSGDLVMGWATTLVSPPDGDLTDFMNSCESLLKHPYSRFYPGHGAPIDQPHDRIRWLLAHRRQRESQILEALTKGPATPQALAQQIYHDVNPALMPAAARNVLAHLIDLLGKSKVCCAMPLTSEREFGLV